MNHPVISLTAVYLKAKHGYVAFIEELPGVKKELLGEKDVPREGFTVSIPPAKEAVTRL